MAELVTAVRTVKQFTVFFVPVARMRVARLLISQAQDLVREREDKGLVLETGVLIRNAEALERMWEAMRRGPDR